MFQRLGGAASAYRFSRPYISINIGSGAELCCTATTAGGSSAVPRRSRSMATTPPSSSSEVVRFADFDVTDQVFLRTEHVVGIVNLKPIVPFHVLLIPPSPNITRLSLLPTASLAPFFRAVQLVTSRLEEVTGASSSNVAIQDGKEAGQSVAHLHVHVLPRKRGDEYAGSDEIYNRLESFGFNLSTLQAKHEAAKANAAAAASGSHTRGIKPDADEDRRPRSQEEMKAEADWLREVFRDVDFGV